MSRPKILIFKQVIFESNLYIAKAFHTHLIISRDVYLVSYLNHHQIYEALCHQQSSPPIIG